MKRLDANIQYLKEHGEVSFWLCTPVNDYSICQLSIEVITPIDPESKCAVRMNLDFVNPYKLGHFDDNQELECHFGIKELKTLRAFPVLLEILTSADADTVKICDVLNALESAGFKKGKGLNERLIELRESFNAISGPTAEQYLLRD